MWLQWLSRDLFIWLLLMSAVTRARRFGCPPRAPGVQCYCIEKSRGLDIFCERSNIDKIRSVLLQVTRPQTPHTLPDSLHLLQTADEAVRFAQTPQSDRSTEQETQASFVLSCVSNTDTELYRVGCCRRQGRRTAKWSDMKLFVDSP